MVAHRVTRKVIPVAKNGYLFRNGAELPIPLGTDSFDYWFRHNPRFRVEIPDGSGRWVGAKKDKGLIVLQKRVNKKLFQTSCGRAYSLRFEHPEYLEERARDLAQKITSAIGEWGNRFPAGKLGEPTAIARKTPKLFVNKSEKRIKGEQSQIEKEAELEYLILSCGQGYQFTAELFYDFFEGAYPLNAIKAAMGRQRAVKNIYRKPNGYYLVSEGVPKVGAT
jgi:hypothetical protein